MTYVPKPPFRPFLNLLCHYYLPLFGKLADEPGCKLHLRPAAMLQKAIKIRDALFGFIAGMAEWLLRKPGII